jgi:hypothetical protein
MKNIYPEHIYGFQGYNCINDKAIFITNILRNQNMPLMLYFEKGADLESEHNVFYVDDDMRGNNTIISEFLNHKVYASQFFQHEINSHKYIFNINASKNKSNRSPGIDIKTIEKIPEVFEYKYDVISALS